LKILAYFFKGKGCAKWRSADEIRGVGSREWGVGGKTFRFETLFGRMSVRK